MVYYDPFDDDDVLERKHAFVERVGAECAAEGVPLFLEPMSYSDRGEAPLERARRKPEVLRRTVAEFSKPRYRVDVLKIEFPLEIALVAGIEPASERPPLYDRAEAMAELQRATAEAAIPFVFLSAGVDMRQFAASLILAGEAGVPFGGVLCGRATWKGGIERYAVGGAEPLRAWLLDEGLSNIRALNEVVAQYGVAVASR
jgi:tagatose 1,6-diphosphate aldolase